MVEKSMENFKDKMFRNSNVLLSYNVVFKTVVKAKDSKSALSLGYKELLHDKGEVEIICLG